MNVRQAIRVLCVDGRPAGDPRLSSVFNLGLALSSRSDPNRPSPNVVETAPETSLLERDLGAYDCVMLSNVAQFTASEARVLDNYLIHGGSLVFFLGDRVIADNYNSVLAGRAPEGSRSVLPADLVAVARNPGGGLDPLDYRHPIVQKFRGQEQAGLLDRPSTDTSKSNLRNRSPSSKVKPLPAVRHGRRRPQAKVEMPSRPRARRQKSYWP